MKRTLTAVLPYLLAFIAGVAVARLTRNLLGDSLQVAALGFILSVMFGFVVGAVMVRRP